MALVYVLYNSIETAWHGPKAPETPFLCFYVSVMLWSEKLEVSVENVINRTKLVDTHGLECCAGLLKQPHKIQQIWLRVLTYLWLNCKRSHEVSSRQEKARKGCRPWSFPTLQWHNLCSNFLLFCTAWMPGCYLHSIKEQQTLCLLCLLIQWISWADCGDRRPHPACPEPCEPAPQFGLDKAKPGKKTDMGTKRAFSLHTVLFLL